MRKAVNNMFSFREYLRKSKANEFDGNEYLRSFIPDKVYKYFSFPKMDSIEETDIEIKKRMTQLEEGKVWLSKRANLNDPFELSCICGNLSDEAKQYVDEVCETREILCLTTSPLNKLMWAHYADSYMGYCIEFSTKGNFPSSYLPDAQIKGMIPVEYINEKQDYSHEIEQFVRAKNEGATNSQSDEDKFMSLFSKLSKCPLVLRAVEAMFVYKDASFSYENELRFITYPADDENLSSLGHLHELNSLGLKITKIIVGMRCSDKNFARLSDVAKNINVDLSTVATQDDLTLKEMEIWKS